MKHFKYRVSACWRGWVVRARRLTRSRRHFQLRQGEQCLGRRLHEAGLCGAHRDRRGCERLNRGDTPAACAASSIKDFRKNLPVHFFLTCNGSEPNRSYLIVGKDRNKYSTPLIAQTDLAFLIHRRKLSLRNLVHSCQIEGTPLLPLNGVQLSQKTWVHR